MGRSSVRSAAGCVEAEVWQAAREVMEAEKPRSLTFNLNQDPKYDTGLVCGGTLEIFIEPVLPAALLYIFGAGHVAASLYKIAQNAGFDVTVVDDRETYANRERFPEALEVIAQDFEQAMARLAPSESSYIVIVTRGHRDDLRVLRWAVQTRAKYVGMIGSKRKTIGVFRELTREGIPADLFGRVCLRWGSTSARLRRRRSRWRSRRNSSPSAAIANGSYRT